MKQNKQTYFELHYQDILTEAKLNKSQFAQLLGVARQNIQKLIATKNVFTLEKIASVLNLPLMFLITGEITDIQNKNKKTKIYS